MPDMAAPTYSLSTYDPGAGPNDPWVFTVRRAGLSRWQLRDAIRWARSEGFDDQISILVERELAS